MIINCRMLSKHDGKFSTHSAIIHADLLYYNTQKTLATQAVDDVRGVMLGFGVQSGSTWRVIKRYVHIETMRRDIQKAPCDF